MVTYDDLKEYLYFLASVRIYMGGTRTKEDVWFLIGRIIYILRKRKVILPYSDKDLEEFVRLQIDADFCNLMLGEYLGEFNDDLKSLYHVGNLKDLLEQMLDITLDSRIIGLYKDHVTVICECGEQAVFMSRQKIQPGAGGNIYYCRACGNLVGVHAGTNIPFGTPADRETRALRVKCHQLFDQQWTTPEEREKAYKWLVKEMHLTKAEGHFGKFNKEKCLEALKLLENPLQN